MDFNATPIDVLCVGNASYDIVFSVNKHPSSDEKCFANSYFSCGGGPAANAAVTVSKLGLKSAFIGYLSADNFGEQQRYELRKANVNIEYIAVGPNPLPISSIYVSPDGHRSVVNYKGTPDFLPADFANEAQLLPRVLLVDGHEPYVSAELAKSMKVLRVPTILDAGSVHEGTKHLIDKVNYIIASEKFAQDYTGFTDERALERISAHAPNVIITRGNKDLLWKNVNGSGQMKPFPIKAVDTTGAGDVFHGAFAYGLAQKMQWGERIKFAMAAAALSCTQMGARPSIPSLKEVQVFMKSF
jgi:sulfofructose kinase